MNKNISRFAALMLTVVLAGSTRALAKDAWLDASEAHCAYGEGVRGEDYTSGFPDADKYFTREARCVIMTHARNPELLSEWHYTDYDQYEGFTREVDRLRDLSKDADSARFQSEARKIKDKIGAIKKKTGARQGKIVAEITALEHKESGDKIENARRIISLAASWKVGSQIFVGITKEELEIDSIEASVRAREAANVKMPQ